MFVVGITGGIGSGKSTVANLFAEKGITLVDADLVARQVVEPGSDGLHQITEHFGQAILLPSGELDRAQLRERIFASPTEKSWLNALLHPLINQEMQQQLANARSPYTLLVVPLLIENQLQHLVNRLLVVDVTEATQIARTTARDQVPASQVRAIMAAQAGRAERCAAADDIINNEVSTFALQQEIDRLHEIYLHLAAE